MNEKNIDKLFRETQVGDLFYIKEIAFTKYINFKDVTDNILPLNYIIATVTKIDHEKIFLFSRESETFEFSKNDLLEYNLLERI